MKTLGSSIRRNWFEMDRPLKLSVAFGLLSGLALPIIYGYYLPQFGVASLSEWLVLSIFYLPFAFFTLPPLLSIIGTIVLLFRRITAERRGIVGFMVFITSIPALLITFSPIEYLWRRST